MPTSPILYHKSCHNVTHYSDHAIQNAFVHELSEYQTLRNLHIYITTVKLAAMWKWKTFLKLWSSVFCWSIHPYKIQSPWRCNLYPPPKHQHKPIVLHSIKTKKTFFFIIKPTRCTNFTNLFWHETLHVSDSSSVHHQEFIHCTHSNGICHTALQTAFEQFHPGPAQKLSTNLYDIYYCWVYSE